MHPVVFLRRHSRDTLFRAIIAVTVLLAAAFLLLYSRYGVGQVIGDTPWYIPMMHSLTALLAAAVAFLSLGRARLLADRVAWRIGAGFAAFAVLSLFFILSLPGQFSGGRGIIAALPGTSGWIRVLEYSAFGAPLLSAAHLALTDRGRSADKPPSFLPLAFYLSAMSLAAALIVVFEGALPQLVDQEGTFSTLYLSFNLLFLLLFASGVALSTCAYLRSGDSLLGYTALAQITVAFVMLTTLIGERRYDLWYYLNRLVLVSGFLTVFFGLLGNLIGLFLRERTAREEAERGRRLLDLSFEAIFVWELYGPILSWNKGAERLYGWSRDEAVGRVGQELLQTRFPEGTEGFLSELIRTGTWTGEIRNRTRDGRTLFVESRLQLVENASGRRIVLEITRDVTDRKRAEESLKRSEQILVQAQSLAHMGSWEWNLKTGQVRWSRELYALYEVDPDTFSPTIQAFAEFVLPEDRDRLERIIDEIVTGGAAVSFDFRIVSATGAMRTLHTVGEIVERDVHGVPLVMVGMNQDITERKREEEERERLATEAAEQKARLQAVLESLPVGVWEADAGGKLLFVNDAASRIYGGPAPLASRVEEYAVYRVFWPDTGEPIAVEDYPLARALRGGTVKEMIMDFERFDGSRGTQLASAVPIRDLQGAITGAVVIALDISEQKRTEEALRESEERFHRIADSMPHLVWTALPDGTVDYFNDRWSEYEGLHPNTDGSWSWQMALHPEDLESTVTAWTRAVSTGSVYEAEHRVRMSDGSYRWHYSKGVPVRDEHGNIEKWYGSATDIQRMKNAETEVRRNEEHYRRALEDSGLVAARCDTDLRYRWVYNPFPDFNPDAVIGKRDDELSTPRDAAGIMALKREVLETGKSVRRELSFQLSDGTHWYSMHAEPLYDPEGNIVGLTTVSRDITEQKKAEESLKEAKEQAEAANNAKSEFLAHMSHELRTPIGGIIGMTDVLAPRIEGDERRGMLSLIRESAETLLSIIGDILDLSRIESGQVSIDPVDFETRSMINSVVNLFQIPAGAKGLALSLEVAESVPEFIHADREKIAQVLRNLISNAVKYTPRGTVRVTVEAPVRSAGKARLQFQVHDTGVGIPEASMERIFSSFVRLRNSVTVRNAEGTGLGLTISKRLTDLLGGTLEVKSTPGKGSTFTFRVEVTELSLVHSRKPTLGSSGVASIRPLRILLAEDNRINQMFLQMMLSESGHTVTAAENGRQAVELLEASRNGGFDLVLMDVQMPEMDGVEATRRIRSLPAPASDIPIIALTAFAMKGDEEKFLKAGMNGYLTKPVNWAELARVITEARG